MEGPPNGGPRDGFRKLHEEIAGVLTPEQKALEEQMRPGGPGGPGRGPGGPPGMNPERMEALKQAMTPEQKARFEKQIEKMKQRMPFGPGGPRGPGGPGGSGEGGPPPPPQ